MDKNEVLKILETAKDKNGEVPMRLVRQAFEKLPEPCDDAVSRQAVIDAVLSVIPYDDYWKEQIEKAVNKLPSAQPDNQTNLCDSCDYSYPDCPSKNDDVIFGNGIGNDNICACNKYKPSAQPKRPKGHWIIDGHHIQCSVCAERMCNTDREGDKIPRNFCPNCGSDNRGEQV